MIYESAQGNMTIAVAGDSMITRPMSMFREKEFLALVELLKSADASVVNLEMLFHGTYTTDFYRHVRDLLHDEVDSLRRGNGVLHDRWSALEAEQARHRNPTSIRS